MNRCITSCAVIFLLDCNHNYVNTETKSTSVTYASDSNSIYCCLRGINLLFTAWLGIVVYKHVVKYSVCEIYDL